MRPVKRKMCVITHFTPNVTFNFMVNLNDITLLNVLTLKPCKALLQVKSISCLDAYNCKVREFLAPENKALFGYGYRPESVE